MKLSALAVHGFIGVKSAVVDLSAAPIHLFVGPNRVGKSSIRDAVALVLTSNLGRVALRKDAAQLVHDGAKAAGCEVIETVETDGLRSERVYGVTITAAGKIHESRDAEVDQTLQYVLDAQSFARLPEKERRAFLFGLMRVRLTPASIVEKLLAKGCDKAKVEIVAPLLRSGFEAAHGDARERGTQCKGVWRTITNETYGSVKGESWKAKPPEGQPADAGLVEARKQQLVTFDQQEAAKNQEIGALKQRRTDLFSKRARLAELRTEAEKVPRLQAKLAADKATRDETQGKVDAASGAPKPVQAWACPCCAALLVLREGKLVEMDATTQTTSNPDAANLAAYQSSLRMSNNAVANTERDLAKAEAAAREVAEIEALADLTADEEKALAEAEKAIDGIKAKRAEAEAWLKAADAYKEAAAAAEKKTADAAAQHRNVVEWEAISSALSPDGIPAEVLAAALTPINARMRQSAADTGWPEITIDGDMEVRAGGRPYGLLSESEKWRADAVVAEAISHISGRKLLVLDRFDVLDMPSRGQLLGWLDTLASMKEVDTAIVCGTLKQRPTGLPDTMAAHWIVDGELEQPAAQKEAA